MGLIIKGTIPRVPCHFPYEPFGMSRGAKITRFEASNVSLGGSGVSIRGFLGL